MSDLRLCVLALVLAGLVAAGCGDDDEEGEAAESQSTEVAVPGAEEAATLQEDVADQTG
jgi:hypothetical protein